MSAAPGAGQRKNYMKKYDYLIVGGGLAGCTLGYLLKKAGKDVIILELLDAVTKNKLCGGIVEDRARLLISQIFAGDELSKSLLKIDTFRKRFGGQELCCRGMKGFTMERKILDDFALRQYINQGGHLLDRACIREIDEARGRAIGENLATGKSFTITFSHLIGADGAFSAVRRMVAEEKPSVGVAFEGEVPLVGRDIVCDMLLNVEAGYSWYIPYMDYAVVGVGCYVLTEGQVFHPKDARDIIGAFCERLGTGFPKKLRGAPIPTGDSVRLRASRRTYFVGDAAGLMRKTDGGGIYYALLSAKCLAEYFLGGEDYETVMEPIVDRIGYLARNARGIQFLSNMAIMRNGRPV